MTTKRYFANGFSIESEIEIPELPFTDLEPNIFIRLGKTPEKIDNPIISRGLQQINENEYLLDIDHAARYWVKNKSEVIVEPYEGVQAEAVRIYILSSVMGVLLHKNDCLPIHSCCIKVNNKAFLVAGVSGAGKSTLSLGMHQKGYEILNDDISTVYFDENQQPYIYSGYKHIKLWAESLNRYGFDPNDFNRLRSEIEKYSFPISREDKIEKTPISAVFILNPGPHDEISTEEVSGLKAFDVLKFNTFRKQFVKPLKKEAIHFKLSTNLASKAKIIRVKRPESMKPAAFSDYMENVFLSFE